MEDVCYVIKMSSAEYVRLTQILKQYENNRLKALERGRSHMTTQAKGPRTTPLVLKIHNIEPVATV